MIIQTQDELNRFCAALSQGPYLTIDTEFLRDRTYYSRLCLLQMAGPDVDAAALDPLDKSLDWAPVFALLKNEKVLKVFHAARQDLEIFYHLMGSIPHPVFDTQVAAMVCGYGESIAYNALVRDVSGHNLEKTAQFTDWSRRPLSKQQLRYALDDVIFLRDVYEKLSQRLHKQGRESWVFEEMAVLIDPNTYAINPDEIWKRIKIRSDKPEVLAVLRALAAWREREAMKRDIPRGHMLKDEVLANLALYMPAKPEDLSHIRGLGQDAGKNRMGQAILAAIAQARALPKTEWPRPERRLPLPRNAQPVLEMLKMLLKITCAEADVAPKLVADTDDLELLATEDQPDIHALKGWRFEIFGKEALDLKAGKVGLSIKNGKIIRQKL